MNEERVALPPDPKRRVRLRRSEKTCIKHAQCWAHCRREFFNAQSAEPVLANEALDRIGKLYKIEEEIRASKLTGESLHL